MDMIVDGTFALCLLYPRARSAPVFTNSSRARYNNQYTRGRDILTSIGIQCTYHVQLPSIKRITSPSRHIYNFENILSLSALTSNSCVHVLLGCLYRNQ